MGLGSRLGWRLKPIEKYQYIWSPIKAIREILHIPEAYPVGLRVWDRSRFQSNTENKAWETTWIMKWKLGYGGFTGVVGGENDYAYLGFLQVNLS